jgi:hypothetical protein
MRLENGTQTGSGASQAYGVRKKSGVEHSSVEEGVRKFDFFQVVLNLFLRQIDKVSD